MKKGYKKFKRVLGILLMVAVLNGSLGLDSLAVRAAEVANGCCADRKGGIQLILKTGRRYDSFFLNTYWRKDMIVQNLTVKSNLI